MTDYEHHIDPDGVAKLLRSLQNGKAPGSDNLGKTDLMIDIKLTAKCLSLIYNKFIEQRELLLGWKTAYVTQVYKSGSQPTASQYRPIFLTSIPCNLLEHILLGDIFLEKINGFLHNRQHGFRRGLSCETQLYATIHDILADKDQSVHALVLDFTKAFDRVPHSLLMEKLSKIKTINEYLLRWIHNFLLNRSQCVIRDRKKV